MTLTIEEGKFYRTREGSRVGPMRRTTAEQKMRDGACFTWVAACRDGWYRTFRDDGGFYATGAVRESVYDLVAEWDDEPPADTKPTNPKDAVATFKAPLHLVPSTLSLYASMAFAEGDAKYTGYNWRVAGVRASVYKSALERHLAKWWNGEWADPQTGVPHLASVLACAGIIVDAHEIGKLNDDRPPTADIGRLADDVERVVRGVYEKFPRKGA